MHSTPLHETAMTQHQARAVQTIDRYWHHLAGKGFIPRRSQIDPKAIQDALDHAFIAEHMSGGHARFRVAGGSIGAVLGMEIAGMPLAVLVEPSMRARFTAEVANLFDSPSKLTLALTAPPSFGQPALCAHLRLYPLRGPADAVSQVLGTFVTSGFIGRMPRRFAIVSVDSCPVTHASALRRLPIRTRGHLSLVISND